MARYIDADNIKLKGIAVLDENLDVLVSLSDIRKSLQLTPTADVVPMAEVDELIFKLECLLCHATGGKLSKHTYDLRTMETVVTDYINDSYEDGFDEGKAEGAREVFADLEGSFCGDGFHYFLAEAVYNKIKRRYTEGEE